MPVCANTVNVIDRLREAKIATVKEKETKREGGGVNKKEMAHTCISKPLGCGCC